MKRKLSKEEKEEEEEWRRMSEYALQHAWGPEDKVWDEFARKEFDVKPKTKTPKQKK